jgi:hypothetical protein
VLRVGRVPSSPHNFVILETKAHLGLNLGLGNALIPIRMNNRLKEFEELLLDNTLFKVQNQALGDRNLKLNEWCQIVQEFTKE